MALHVGDNATDVRANRDSLISRLGLLEHLYGLIKFMGLMLSMLPMLRKFLMLMVVTLTSLRRYVLL